MSKREAPEGHGLLTLVWGPGEAGGWGRHNNSNEGGTKELSEVPCWLTAKQWRPQSIATRDVPMPWISWEAASPSDKNAGRPTAGWWPCGTKNRGISKAHQGFWLYECKTMWAGLSHQVNSEFYSSNSKQMQYTNQEEEKKCTCRKNYNRNGLQIKKWQKIGEWSSLKALMKEKNTTARKVRNLDDFRKIRIIMLKTYTTDIQIYSTLWYLRYGNLGISLEKQIIGTE